MNTGLIDKVQCLWTNRNNENEVIHLLSISLFSLLSKIFCKIRFTPYEESMPSVGTAESSMWVNYKPGKPVIIQGYQTKAQIKVRIVKLVDFEALICRSIIFKASVYNKYLSYTWTTCDSKAKLL